MRCLFCACFLLFVFHVSFCLLSFLFLVALQLPAGRRLASWLSCVLCFLVFLLLSHVQCKVRCASWLYQFLIFAFIFTLKNKVLVLCIWEKVKTLMSLHICAISWIDASPCCILSVFHISNSQEKKLLLTQF